MAFHGFSFGSLLLMAVIVAIIFGTKRLRNIGEDLGAAVQSFRKGLQGDVEKNNDKDPQ